MASRQRPASQAPKKGSKTRRDSKEIAAQYVAGKKFKVKCIGNQYLSDYRGGDAMVSDCMNQIRQECIRLKSKKLKATITLQLKGFIVFEEKSKTVTLKMPIEKVKFVCHDHHDMSVFGVVVSVNINGPTGVSDGHKLYAFQAEQKVAVSFVRSTNELFTIVYKMIKAKRRLQSQSSLQGSSNSSPEQGSSEESSGQAHQTVNLGFGIPGPPPSYKDALTNSDMYKIPENVQVAPVVLAPPPKPASSGRLPSGSTSQTGTIIQLLPDPQTAPTFSTADGVTSSAATLPGPKPIPRPIIQLLPDPQTTPNFSTADGVTSSAATLPGPKPIPRPRQSHALESNSVPGQIQYTSVATHQSNTQRGQSSNVVQVPLTSLTGDVAREIPENMQLQQVNPIVLPPPPKSASGGRLLSGSIRPRPQPIPNFSTADGTSASTLPGPKPIPRPRQSHALESNYVPGQIQDTSLATHQSNSQRGQSSNVVQAPLTSFTGDVAREIPENMQLQQVNPIVLHPPPTAASSGRLPSGSTRPHPQTTPNLSTTDDVTLSAATLPGPKPIPRPRQSHALESNYVPGQIQDGTITSLEAHQSSSPRGQPSNLVQATSTCLTEVVTVESSEQPISQTNERKNVWEEWRSLEGQLQDLAEEIGVEMNLAANNVGSPSQSKHLPVSGAVSHQTTSLPDQPSIAGDLFVDNFFQSSFGSPSKFDAHNQQAQDVSGTFFASLDDFGTDNASHTQGEHFPTNPFSSLISTVLPLQTSSPIVSSTLTTDTNVQTVSTDLFSSTTMSLVSITNGTVGSIANRSGLNSNPILSAMWASTDGQSEQVLHKVDSFETDFSSTVGFSQPTGAQPLARVSGGKEQGYLLPSPPPKKSRDHSENLASRPRPRRSGSINSFLSGKSSTHQMDTFQVQSTSYYDPSLGTSAFSDGFSSPNFTSDDDSTLQLSNPLYQSQISNNVFLNEQQTQISSPGVRQPMTSGTNMSAAMMTDLPVFPSDQNLSSNLTQAEYSTPFQMQASPIVQSETVTVSQQLSDLPFTNPLQLSDQANVAYEFSPAGFPPVPGPAFSSPFHAVPFQLVPGAVQGESSILFPAVPENALMETTNPFAGNFVSPPFAVHSSTPHTAGQLENVSYVQPNSSSISLLDSPDPFANLLPLALSPSKTKKASSKEQAPITTEPDSSINIPRESMPTLNQLYTKRNSFQFPADEDLVIQPETNQVTDGADSLLKMSSLSSKNDSQRVDPFVSSNTSEAANISAKTGDNFDSSSPWIAF